MIVFHVYRINTWLFLIKPPLTPFCVHSYWGNMILGRPTHDLRVNLNIVIEEKRKGTEEKKAVTGRGSC